MPNQDFAQQALKKPLSGRSISHKSKCMLLPARKSATEQNIMTEKTFRALLPQGLRDILPPDADHEADVVAHIMACFSQLGYQRVKPPLIEFEETLLDGAGAATSGHSFRVMDPLSNHMMGLRADMTPQVARIAVARLSGSPRPLRLSYAGDVLRVKGSQLNPDRQSSQAGLELIGSSSLSADAEVLVLAVAALTEVGVPEISIDLSLPPLVPMILAQAGLSAASLETVRKALYHKDAALVRDEAGAAAPVLLALMEASGSLDRALERLKALSLPGQATQLRAHLLDVVALIRAQAPGLSLTLDLVENRGFEYHTGLAFTIFSRRGGGELGRGGRYLAGGGEPATGATLFLDGILAVAAKPAGGKCIYVPLEFVGDKAKTLRAEGWITLLGLETTALPHVEAKRLGCAYVLTKGGPEAVA